MHRRQFVQLSAAALTASLARPLLALPKDDPYFSTIGLQLWTVRGQMKEDAAATMKAIADAGYKQVELGDPGNDELFKLAKDNGMSVTSSFINWEILANPKSDAYGTFDKVLEAAVEHGLKHLVFGYVGKGHRETVDQYKAMAEKCNAAGESCTKAGIQLCYHNHAFEYEEIDGDKTGFDIFMAEFDKEYMKFELDVFWAKIGGWDPVETMEKLDGRISQLHLKDLAKDTPVIYDEGQVPVEAFKEVGNGSIDFAKVLKLAKKIGVEQCHVEQDQSPDPIASIGESYQFLSKM